MSIKFGPPKARKVHPEPNTPAQEEQRGASVSSAAAANAALVSPGPSPPVSRAPTPAAAPVSPGPSPPVSRAPTPAPMLNSAQMHTATNVVIGDPHSAVQSTSAKSSDLTRQPTSVAHIPPASQVISLEPAHPSFVARNINVPDVPAALVHPALAVQDPPSEPIHPSSVMQSLPTLSDAAAAPTHLTPTSQDVGIEPAYPVTMLHSVDRTLATPGPSVAGAVSTQPSHTPSLEQSTSRNSPVPTAFDSQSTVSADGDGSSAPPMSGSAAVPNVDELAGMAAHKATRKRSGTSTTRANQKKKQRTAAESTLAATSVSISHTAMDVDAPPPWVVNALELLRSEAFGEEWDSLLVAWLRFEDGSGYQGSTKLGTRHRPSFIGDWIKNYRTPTYRPEIKNIGAFATDFIAWWQSLQPKWRIDNARTNANGDVSWEEIRRPGVNGLLSVLAGLFLWGRAIRNAKPAAKKHWLESVNDVSFVITQLL